MTIDIHSYDLSFQRELVNLEKSGLTQKNKEIVRTFLSDSALQGISKARQVRNAQLLRYIGMWLGKDFKTATTEDIKNVVRTIDGQNYTAWTKSTYKKILKKFYRTIKGRNGDYPKEVKWLKTMPNAKELAHLSSQDLITSEEVKKAIEFSDHPRNKAFLAVLAESGCRVGEVGTLIMKSIAFDQHGAVLTVNGKTGPRQVRICSSTPYLATWLNSHPFRADLNAAVWINVGSTNNRQPMKYEALAKVLRDAFLRAGIKKRCNPHMFRHSRATFAAQFMTEAQMKQYFGWTQGSSMPGTYVHLSGKDIDGTVLKMNGFEVPAEKKADVQKPRVCPRCTTLNTQDSAYCMKCAAILDEKIVLEMQAKAIGQQQANQNINGLMDILIKDPEVQKLLVSKILTLGLQGHVTAPDLSFRALSQEVLRT